VGEDQYQSLYRRYRPQRFSEVRGQDQVTRPLRNAVREGKAAHAYLFSGPRGTGKTSTARILAMALNCEHPVDGEPDGACPSCIDIRRGASMDVHELDAASNRKLDEMRDLLSRVALGTRGRWKVYIIDEVHQLTPDAASALLKTLEEPPGHVVFVLATTDPQKVLPTIRSRTQHFEFRLLPADVLSDLLQDVTKEAGLGVDAGAIDLVVRRGHGSARDALSALDQVAAAGTVEDETAVLTQMVDALADREVGGVLTGVAEAMAAGRDARRLGADLLDHLRNGFLATQARALVLLPDGAVDAVAAQAQRLGLPALVRAMEAIGQALVDMRDSVDPRVTLEAALIRLAHPEADHSPAALLERIDRLERQLAQARPAGSAGSAGVPASPSPPPGAGASSPIGPRRSGGNPPAPPTARGPSRSSPVSSPAASPSPVAGSPLPPSDPPAAANRPPGVAAARAALGAHRRPPGAAAAPAGSPPDSLGRPGAQPPASDRRPPPPGPAAPPGTAPDPPGAGAAMPSRDNLTTAWGDVILPALRPVVRAYMSQGRFAAVEGDEAVFALPDRPLLSRAGQVKGEAEDMLSAHFHRRVRLRLVHDPGVAAASPQPPDDPSAIDLSELADAGGEGLTPEQRLLQAFPGAQEVNP
jgi:DNA polymerase-3 subunit gamma/tau